MNFRPRKKEVVKEEIVQETYFDSTYGDLKEGLNDNNVVVNIVSRIRFLRG